MVTASHWLPNSGHCYYKPGITEGNQSMQGEEEKEPPKHTIWPQCPKKAQ